MSASMDLTATSFALTGARSTECSAELRGTRSA